MHFEANAPEIVFRQRVRQLRQQRGWTQADLAGRVANHPGVDLDQSKIARIESNKRALSLAEAVALARVLDSSVDLMLLERVSLQDQIADAERYIEELAVISVNTALELEHAEERLGRLRERLAEIDEGGGTDGEHQEEA